MEYWWVAACSHTWGLSEAPVARQSQGLQRAGLHRAGLWGVLFPLKWNVGTAAMVCLELSKGV